METSLYLPIVLIVGGIIFLILFFHYVPFFLWLSAKVSGVNISLIQLFLMRIQCSAVYHCSGHDRSPQSRIEEHHP